MRVLLADPTGFCFGVRRAVDALEAALRSEGSVVSIGMPIHNPQEVERLKGLGLVVAGSASEVPAGAAVFIRAHGEPRDVYDRLRANGSRIIDATCPFVKRVQDKARELTEAGYSVVLLGDRDHPEVRSIIGHCGAGSEAGREAGITVVKTPGEAESLEFAPSARIGVISQTTQREEDLERLAHILREKVCERAGDLAVSNTICRATVERQQAVRRLAGSVEGMIIIGGRNSANTMKLYEIARAGCADAILVESADELERGWLEGKSVIGAVAGASTPEWLIAAIHKAAENMTVG